MSDPRKSHVNEVVWTATGRRSSPACTSATRTSLAYVKNQGLNFEVPYRDGATPRRYCPDFIVRIDDGGDEPLNLIVEIKGYRGTMRS